MQRAHLRKHMCMMQASKCVRWTAGELFVRALIRRIALRVAEEAAAPPRRAATYGAGAQRPFAATRAEAAEPSRWVEDIIAASPLWLLLPQSLLSGSANTPPVRKQTEEN